MDFAMLDNGSKIDLVCKLVVFDHAHESHLMMTVNGCKLFHFDGLLSEGFASYTIFDATMDQQFPVPKVSSNDATRVLGHEQPSWDNLHRTIDLCSGFGGLSQGAIAAGFEVSVAVDHNESMLGLYSKNSSAPTVLGDIGDKDVLHKVWSVSKGAKIISSGFSCQPFSRLGDGRSCEDARASCLPKTLSAAFYLQAKLIVLECVSPAGHDNFVKEELVHFQNCTGYTCSQIDLKLDEVWPCRRHRAWWLLVAPDIGPIDMHPWTPLSNLGQVQNVIPSILLWSEEDEQDLMLDATEHAAFGIDANEHGRNMLNAKGVAPCALHAWGNQLRPCPCGCRMFPLSAARLAAKGLHGCLVRSACHADGNSYIRHLHPSEAMCLNSMDPVIDFCANPRLVLSAVGQIAAPVQALWVFGFISLRLSKLMNCPNQFHPDSQIQAYRSWVLMRSRLVWKPIHETIDDPKLLALVAFWETQHDLSLEELLYPIRWKGVINAPVSNAAVLDHLIRTQVSGIPVTIPDSEEDVAPTPWFDAPKVETEGTNHDCLCEDSCTVVIEGTEDSPIRFQPKCDSTVGDFILAQQKLVGHLQVDRITMNGIPISREHVMSVGQLICITLGSAGETSSVSPPRVAENAIVSPTLDWQPDPIEDVPIASPPRKTTKFDIGECMIPHPSQVSEDQWLDAGPLLGLQGEQFLCLRSPTINSPQQLWSVRHQFLKVSDRLGILERQAELWADDEIRFHLHNLVQMSMEVFPKKGLRAPPLLVLDPLLITTWVQNRGFDCECWAREHPEVLRESVCILTAVLVEQHWIPVFMSPSNGTLHVHTWDGMGAKHDAVDALVHRLAKGLGFTQCLICREHRLFFTSNLCGALAVAFLRMMVFGNQLPSNPEEAEYVHAQLRQQFVHLIQPCQVTRRPWVWGAGDHQTNPPNVLDIHAISVTRDERIDMMNQKGFAMADDEIRFHIIQLVNHQPRRVNWRGTFTFLEPLVFSCWENIGRVTAERWAESHPHVFDDGQHVATAVCVDEHWLPLWLVPDDMILQVHTFNDEHAGRARLEMILQALAQRLGFRDIAVHRIPKLISDDSKCGAYAMAFLAHVITRMPLPETASELHTLHTNMRASFVEHLYGVLLTPRPVVWGFGPPRESRPLPRMPAEGSSGSAQRFDAMRESGPLPRMPVEAASSSATWNVPRASADDVSIKSTSSDQDTVISHESTNLMSSFLPSCCLREDFHQSLDCWPALSLFCTCPAALPPTDERTHIRQLRLESIATHGHAMADDEILFHLEFVLDFFRRIPTSSQQVVRQFVHIPPLTVAHWLAGNHFEMRKWQDEMQIRDNFCHVLFVACIDQHWLPFWLAPHDHALHCHSFHFPGVDTTGIDVALRQMVYDLGFQECVIHRVPTPIHETGLCGAMAISFLAHVVLRTPLPVDDQQLRDRSWKMKQKFADNIEHRPPTTPMIWGWKGFWESRPLPRMPVGPFVPNTMPDLIEFFSNDTEFLKEPKPHQFGWAMGPDEIQFHLERMSNKCPAQIDIRVWCHDTELLLDLIHHLPEQSILCAAVLENNHWIPLVISQDQGFTHVLTETSNLSAGLRAFSNMLVQELPTYGFDTCGANTLATIAVAMGFQLRVTDMTEFHRFCNRFPLTVTVKAHVGVLDLPAISCAPLQKNLSSMGSLPRLLKRGQMKQSKLWVANRCQPH